MPTPLSASVETRSTSLPDHIRVSLEADMREGRLKPGMAIDEPALCERFGVSRTPVREALLLMAAKGLVSIVPRSGIYVRQLDARELVAMMEGLSELEGVLARLAASRISVAQKAALDQALAETGARADAGDPAGYEKANARLHEVIYQASGNGFIVEQTRELRLRIATYLGRSFERPGRLAQSQAEHHDVVRALHAGDSDGAAEAMRNHVLVGGKVFAELVLNATTDTSYTRERRRKPASA